MCVCVCVCRRVRVQTWIYTNSRVVNNSGFSQFCFSGRLEVVLEDTVVLLAATAWLAMQMQTQYQIKKKHFNTNRTKQNKTTL